MIQRETAFASTHAVPVYRLGTWTGRTARWRIELGVSIHLWLYKQRDGQLPDVSSVTRIVQAICFCHLLNMPRLLHRADGVQHQKNGWRKSTLDSRPHFGCCAWQDFTDMQTSKNLPEPGAEKEAFAKIENKTKNTSLGRRAMTERKMMTRLQWDSRCNRFGARPIVLGWVNDRTPHPNETSSLIYVRNGREDKITTRNPLLPKGD